MLASRQVAAAMQQRLLDASTDAGTSVYLGRGWPVDTDRAIKVALGDEDLGADAAGDDITWPRERTHSLLVDVMCVAGEAAGSDAAADQLAEQVLIELEGSVDATTLDPLTGVHLAATRLSRTQQADGAAVLAITTVTFEAQFSTRSNDPSTLI